MKKKICILIVSIIFAISFISVGYAYWEQDLNIEGEIKIMKIDDGDNSDQIDTVIDEKEKEIKIPVEESNQPE